MSESGVFERISESNFSKSLLQDMLTNNQVVQNNHNRLTWRYSGPRGRVAILQFASAGAGKHIFGLGGRKEQNL